MMRKTYLTVPGHDYPLRQSNVSGRLSSWIDIGNNVRAVSGSAEPQSAAGRILALSLYTSMYCRYILYCCRCMFRRASTINHTTIPTRQTTTLHFSLLLDRLGMT